MKQSFIRTRPGMSSMSLRDSFRGFFRDLEDSGYYGISHPWNRGDFTSSSTCYISVPLIAMHCANWQVNLHWQNQRGRPGIGRTDPSGRAVTETPAFMISGYAPAGYIRDEMARTYFRYQGRCREINRSLNKSCVCARAYVNGLCVDRRCQIATSVNFVNVFCKSNSQCNWINK